MRQHCNLPRCPTGNGEKQSTIKDSDGGREAEVESWRLESGTLSGVNAQGEVVGGYVRVEGEEENVYDEFGNVVEGTYQEEPSLGDGEVPVPEPKLEYRQDLATQGDSRGYRDGPMGLTPGGEANPEVRHREGPSPDPRAAIVGSHSSLPTHIQLPPRPGEPDLRTSAGRAMLLAMVEKEREDRAKEKKRVEIVGPKGQPGGTSSLGPLNNPDPPMSPQSKQRGRAERPATDRRPYTEQPKRNTPGWNQWLSCRPGREDSQRRPSRNATDGRLDNSQHRSRRKQRLERQLAEDD